jgi:Holliday junction resolvase
VSGYAKGTRFEHKVRDDLETNGYAVVRAAGSKGGTKADLLGFKPGQLLLVQCKRTGKTLPAEEWNRLVEVASWIPGAVALWAEKGPRGQAVAYTRLLGPKVPHARIGAQPVAPFALDEVAS